MYSALKSYTPMIASSHPQVISRVLYLLLEVHYAFVSFYIFYFTYLFTFMKTYFLLFRINLFSCPGLYSCFATLSKLENSTHSNITRWHFSDTVKHKKYKNILQYNNLCENVKYKYITERETKYIHLIWIHYYLFWDRNCTGPLN